MDEESGDGGPSSASNSGDATHEGQREVINNSSGPWTDAEWDEWMARRRTWYSWPPTTTTPSGGDGSASRDAFVSSDPWQSQGDPWELVQTVKMTVWGVVTKSAYLNSQVKTTKMAW